MTEQSDRVSRRRCREASKEIVRPNEVCCLFVARVTEVCPGKVETEGRFEAWQIRIDRVGSRRFRLGMAPSRERKWFYGALPGRVRSSVHEVELFFGLI